MSKEVIDQVNITRNINNYKKMLRKKRKVYGELKRLQKNQKVINKKNKNKKLNKKKRKYKYQNVLILIIFIYKNMEQN